MHIFLVGYLVASTIASALFIAAGWWAHKVRSRDSMLAEHCAGATTGLGESVVSADVRACVLMALIRLEPVIEHHGVQIEIGIVPGLLVAMTTAALTDVLDRILTKLIHKAYGQRFCITALARGDQILIGLIDSDGIRDRKAPVADFRSLIEHIAMLGNTLTVGLSGTGGIMLTIRLTAAPNQGWVITDAREAVTSSTTVAPFSTEHHSG